ncbi:hypothetical protein EYF80_029111 [Liparis tanakae]|uniref:Uncharacterized protein n=1 Tax=Liparis tanakae TaxID=230148 RepID=A0A4Z2H463_9TELE|nr:hypothetical protein EYF80_029111 [Liparis tanakae]
MEEHNGARVLLVSEDYATVDGCLCVLKGRECDLTSFPFKDLCGRLFSTLSKNYPPKGPCKHTCLQTAECQQQSYDAYLCNTMYPQVEDKYIIDMERRSCINCNPGKLPEEKNDLNIKFPTEYGEDINAAKAK